MDKPMTLTLRRQGRALLGAREHLQEMLPEQVFQLVPMTVFLKGMTDGISAAGRLDQRLHGQMSP